MRHPSLIPALLSIALLGACGQVMGAEARDMGTDGTGTCPESATAGIDRIDDGEPDPNAPATSAKRQDKTKAVATPRASGGNRSTAPRWHSFLPGMFR